MSAFYNEIDPYAAAWLKNLMDAGEIAHGVMDTRSILDVSPKDLAGFDRCHFFAGVAGWDLALQLAGWPTDQPVWTGSCPCQPFSSAGRGTGGADERHLWPAWFWLIRQCRPPVIFGEQVASKAGLSWLDVVFSDLEAAGYACGAADLCAAGLGAPHIRQRLWFCAIDVLANTNLQRSHAKETSHREKRWRSAESGMGSTTGLLGHARGQDNGGRGIQRPGESDSQILGQNSSQRPAGPGPTGELADCQQQGLEGCHRPRFMELQGREKQIRSVGESSTVNNPWSPLHWLPCRDGKWRPTGGVAQPKGPRWGVWDTHDLGKTNGEVNPLGNYNQVDQGEPEELGPTQSIILPLAHGVPARVGRLRAYGNAIVPQIAAVFIKAMMEALAEMA